MKKLYVALLAGFLLPSFVLASDITDKLNQAGQEPFGTTVESARTPGQFVGDIITIALGFVGMLALIYFLYGGFLWLSAGGNSGQVETAQAIIKRAVIGVIIIASAYTLTFTVTNLVFSTAR